jgi:ATP-binding cassette subfamily B protein
LIDGTDIRKASLASLRDQIGIVFQDTFLFGTSIRENLALARPGASNADIEAASKAAELHEFVSSLPRGYDTLVGERGGRLSGGQRQRLAIARALLRNPRILLLDEATSALDPRTERLIADTLNKVGRGRTTIAVTHRLTSVTDCDQIFVVVAGRIAEQGTHHELVARGGPYAELWAEQTGGRISIAAPFDEVGGLARVPLFTGLGRPEVAAIASRLRAVELSPGETVPEGGGRLMLIRSGRARVLTPSLTGELVPTTELGPGDAFGVSAVLGNDTGAILQAGERVVLLVLDDQALAGIAATYPAVAEALKGAGRRVVPAGGRHLSRLTLGPSVSASAMSLPSTMPGQSPAEAGHVSQALRFSP